MASIDETERQPTYGERAAGVSFNPSNNPAVDSIKRKCADLIDEIDGLRNSHDSEVRRMASTAITEIQSGQMWAVKAVTWR
jgi:hypothetical protein